ILVSGLFQCGDATQPFAGKLDIILKEGTPLMMMGERTFAVKSPGVLKLFGQQHNIGWQRLAKTTQPGDRMVYLRHPVKWLPGDEVVIGPSGFDPNEAERLVVDKVVNEKQVWFKQTLKYTHWGQIQNFVTPQRTWRLDESAEIANLNRNIKIYPSGTPASHDSIGAHLMVMKGAQAYVDAVEFKYMGQMGIMARYPFHWHRAGNVEGQYIVNSSLHDTYQRCITVHGTNNSLVKNNVCYNHFGHGYFLEDGNEINNHIIGNLGILAKRVPSHRALLVSDFSGNADRFSAPANFWISNPKNYIENNVASGSEGTGFWMAFSKAINCSEQQCLFDPENPNITPTTEKTGRFDNNIAHSTEVGITWDGAPDGALRNNPNNPNDRELLPAHYFPAEIPVFKNLVTFKNLNTGIYFRGRTAEFINNIHANNGVSLFFAYNQVVRNSLVIGMSDNFGDQDFDYLFSKGKRSGQRGALVYDGPFDFQDIDFVDFSAQKVLYKGRDMTPTAIAAIGGANRFTNTVSNIKFLPEPLYKMQYNTSYSWSDTPWSMSLLDLDGSLTGMSHTLIVPNHEFNKDPSCVEDKEWGAYLCNYEVGVMVFLSKQTQSVPFKVTRSDGARTVASAKTMVNKYHRKFQAILNKDYEYSVEFANESTKSEVFAFMFQTPNVNDLSPVIKLENMGEQCQLPGYPALANLNSLRISPKTSYYNDGKNLYIKVLTNRINPNNRSQNAPKGFSGAIPLKCQ
ncbi:MAG: hypothetical protein KDD40_07350, partial [Bdellovibrionales bacterium]|nr:hypothetical protein [Bdellovibrionales bacterium]